MLKLFAALASSIVIFVASFFPFNEEEVNVQMSAPSQVKPGNEFIVSVNIEKGNISSFARFQQYLPAGFTATPLQTENAEFTFENGTVKFIWTVLPNIPQFSISYKVKTDASLDGFKNIDGMFSFVRNDRTENYKLSTLTINVSDANNLSAQETNTDEEQNMAIQREITQIIPERNEYKITLTIKTNRENGSATFYDQLPESYKAEVINSAGAKFFFENRIVKFAWDQMPADSILHISYFASSKKLFKVKPGITGMMVYGSPLNESPIPMAEAKSKNAVAIPESKQVNELLSTSSETKKENQETSTAQSSAEKNTEQKINSTPPAVISAGKQGIYFSVQIAAAERSPARDQTYFEKAFKITDPVLLTMHEGWKKYVIGSFYSLNEARDFQSKAREKSNGAFVVAYNNGERISVSEALQAMRNGGSLSMK